MKETINNSLETAKALTTEPVMKMVNQRLSNPFFLYFMSSWIICNWDRVLLLIFAFNLNIEKRIEKLKALPSNSVFWDISIPHAHTIWYPFIAAVFFVIGAPFVSYCVDLIHNGVVSKKNVNDSIRKQKDFDLKIAEIIKQVKYDNIGEQEKLKAKKALKEIEIGIDSLDNDYENLLNIIKELDKGVAFRKSNIERQDKEYERVLELLEKTTEELNLKSNELSYLNGKVIENQRLLSYIEKEISSNNLPGGILGISSMLSSAIESSKTFSDRENKMAESDIVELKNTQEVVKGNDAGVSNIYPD
ncbi:hypothetical protein [Pectobacterium carotovorum]|uniref:hypothetical protein n=1 Tax=Pectobacterium carotovorum TaxID=554 RepID=UPI0018897C6D|nr:hypothetical protein [Pectobacterium carotovorum]